MKTRYVISLILCSMFATKAFGANLLEVFELALENDATLNAQRFATDAEGLKRDIRRSSVLPTVSVGGSYLDRHTRRTEVDSTSGEVSLNVPLYTAALQPSLSISEAEESVAELRYEKTKQNLYSRVVNAYFQILASQDNLDTTTSQVKAISEFLKVTRERSIVGLGTETDVQNALAREALAQATSIRDQSSIESAWLALVEITRERPQLLSRLKDELTMPELMPNDVQYWVELAQEHNLDLAIQREAVNRSAHAIRAADSDTGPNVSMNLTKRVYGDKPSSNPEQSTISLTVRKSFSLAGHGRKLKQQARLYHLTEVERLKALTQNVKSTVSSVYLNLISLYNRIEALEAAKLASESALEATDQGYLVGTLTSVDVLNAQHDLFQVTRDLHRARYDYLINSIVLRELAGTLDLGDLENMNSFLE